MSNCRIDAPSGAGAVTEAFRCDAYAFIPPWHREMDSVAFFTMMARYVDRRTHEHGRGISTMSTLRPRAASTARGRRYSDIYGLDEFPLHTDLAHWARPPRYVLLRCLVGCADVYTNLLPASVLEYTFGKKALFQAIFCSDKHWTRRFPALLPMVFLDGDVRGIRWDQHSLKPMNTVAIDIARSLSIKASEHGAIQRPCLSDPGDTLIIDNWRCLHGRSQVPKDGHCREVQRIYLSGVHDV